MVVADVFLVIRVIFTLIRMLGCTRQLRDQQKVEKIRIWNNGWHLGSIQLCADSVMVIAIWHGPFGALKRRCWCTQLRKRVMKANT